MAIDPLHSQPPPGGPMSVEKYLQLNHNTPDVKYEYLDGVARLMSGGSIEHARISRNIANAIEQNLLSGPCSVFSSDVQVLIGTKANGKKHYVYPDATVSCDVSDRRRGNKLVRSPRIVIEVLSPRTEATDREEKLWAYQACASIQEIILVSQFAKHVEVYRRPENEQEEWTAVMYNAQSLVELQSIDIQLTMDEIYKGIDFDEPLVEDV